MKLGQIYENDEKFEQAEKLCKAAMEQFPESLNVRMEPGGLYQSSLTAHTKHKPGSPDFLFPCRSFLTRQTNHR